MKPKIGLIGAGNIGAELYRRTQNRKWDVEAVIDIDGIYRGLPKKEKLGEVGDYTKYISGLDLGFLAIPTLDEGNLAFRYMKDCLDRNVPIVTCEKGALSNHFSELENEIKKGRIGYSATVGQVDDLTNQCSDLTTVANINLSPFGIEYCLRTLRRIF